MKNVFLQKNDTVLTTFEITNFKIAHLMYHCIETFNKVK
jgi:hypothetical protein